jgi:hypothetical protein
MTRPRLRLAAKRLLSTAVGSVLLLLLATAPARADVYPSVVQFASNVAVSTTVTTPGITSTTGHMFVVITSGELAPASSPPITDTSSNGSNTWALAERTTTGDSKVGIYYTTTRVGGTSHTFTYTPTASDFCTITVLEIANVPTSSPLSGHTSTVATSTTHSSGNITAGSDNELWIGAGGLDHVAENTSVITQGGVWVTAAFGSPAASDGYIIGFRTAPAGATGQYTYVASSSFPEGSAIVGFKVAASGGSATETAYTFVR